MIEPAMSAEEWAEIFKHATMPWAKGDVRAIDTAFEDTTQSDHHYYAALALHGQPFGFSWEMVDAIRECVKAFLDAPFAMAEDEEGPLASAAADRIAALLPPREPK